MWFAVHSTQQQFLLKIDKSSLISFIRNCDVLPKKSRDIFPNLIFLRVLSINEKNSHLTRSLIK